MGQWWRASHEHECHDRCSRESSRRDGSWLARHVRVAPPDRRPEKLLKLYDIEASPYCRLVREVLTELNQRARSWHERRGYRERGDTVARWTEFDGREVEHDCWMFERQFDPPRP